jgi:hypothetical protein
MALSDKMKDTAAKAKQGATAEKAHLKESAHEAETFATEHSAEALERLAEVRAHAKDKVKKS